ncbi:MAG TPA: histidine phosphatase family protein [Anaerolineae bacterium]|nr:histidine phosphatase family protein [Anaerolineae bacterium]MCB0225900.1 histidine phosphatase family protein [Anaerolineae bacterium]MCB9104137.1 histidine phosphatase family protein [Anaerolineales bacterium]HRV91254.1 histidine phosphatase family protein [Anaerolineae bacterium]
MSKYIWLIRHGESEGNLEGRIQGWQDFPLTNRGRRQAARLAERLAEENAIQEVITSPLARAATTAEIIGAVLGLPIRYDDRLKEYNFGPIEGLTKAEIKEQFPLVWAAWQLNEFWEPLPGEEGERTFEQRIRAAMTDIINSLAEEAAVAVVMHGGAMNTCVRSWLGINERGWRTFAFDNASVNLVQLQAKVLSGLDDDSEQEAFRMLGFVEQGDQVEYNYRMVLLNDTSHLGGLMGSRPAWFSGPRSSKT